MQKNFTRDGKNNMNTFLVFIYEIITIIINLTVMSHYEFYQKVVHSAVRFKFSDH